MVNEVSDLTKLDWHKVFEMEIVEFLTIVAYSRDKANYEKQQMQRWRQTH